MVPSTTPTSLRDRTVIVSGAAGKIGSVVCLALGEAGANVVVNDINAQAVGDLVSLLISKGHSAIGVSESANSGGAIVKKAIDKYGAVHAVVNAILGSFAWKPFEQITDDQFQANFLANVMAPFSIIRASWPHFKNQRYGRVVNFTSDSMLGFPTASDYTMSKGALFGVNKTLAMEGAEYNIKVNCVSPIAFVPAMERHIQVFSPQAQDAFRDLYTPEANVPMILALISGQCSASGEVFSVAGFGAGRCVWGVQNGVSNLRTVDDCLTAMDGLCKKGEQPIFEPSSMVDFTENQVKYTITLPGDQ